MAGKRPLLPDTIAPGWLVVHVLGTLFIAATLLTAREDTGWIWALYGASAACWTAFVVLDHRAAAWAAGCLAVSSLLPSAVLGLADDSSALVLAFITLGRFAALLAPSVTVIVLLGLLDIAAATAGSLPAGRSPLEAGADLGLLLVIVLLGLNRRQYEVQANQAEKLLEQTHRAQAEHARAAALDERTRIAREIHDVLAHSLGALGIQLELAEALLAEKSDVDGALATVRRSRRLAADGLAEARNAVAALRQDVPSLTGALRVLTEDHRRDHQSDVDFRAEGAERAVSSAATVALLGTAREALTNAAKHAPGSPVTLALEFADGAVRLRVGNELPTTPGDRSGPGGFGLSGMRERLALAGGTLNSGPRGPEWQVYAEVPE
ncbi:sensor histidine kinase [Amycolatopsis anabasis]|uniref:sensor histidine kinase n=1 Tax=Amycolatopsis anabasis TaxID=1840409 RepID=UPI00131DE44E|nr:histidine kinase [Amycolatopsis anabasis]